MKKTSVKYWFSILLLTNIAPCFCEESEKEMFPSTGSWGVVAMTPYHDKALKAINVQWVRLVVNWNRVENEEKGIYDWRIVDKFINFYLSSGFKVMICLNIDIRSPAYKDEKDNEKVIKAAADWMGAIAARFSGKEIVWEIGNEPRCFPMGDFWNNPLTYTEMARLAAKSIKDADPNSKVAALSVGWMDRDFITKAFEGGLLEDGTIDIIAFHGYDRGAMAPEFHLKEDVTWLRQSIGEFARHRSPSSIIVADTERGYAILPMQQPKQNVVWMNMTYSKSEQAAFLARHYLEEISLGIEISMWYKDMFGESGFSLYYADENDPQGLRPMGIVYRNLAALLPYNPKEMVNSKFRVSMESGKLWEDSQDPRDPGIILRSFLINQDGKSQLIVAAWRPIEAFDGMILDSRSFQGTVQEKWRPVSKDDKVEVDSTLKIDGIDPFAIKNVRQLNELEPDLARVYKTYAYETGSGESIKLSISVGPIPSIFVIDFVDQ